jgi:hypothetical protein
MERQAKEGTEMNMEPGPASGAATLNEMNEFGMFPKGTQRYIRRSLDVGLGRNHTVRRWARDASEVASIRSQARVYERLDQVRRLIPDGDGIEPTERMLTPLVSMTIFDLSAGRLSCFASYRFLYERLLGAAVRPWLPAAFCAAAALPQLHPKLRETLLHSISHAAVTAPGWSIREPSFFPEWVDKVDAALVA